MKAALRRRANGMMVEKRITKDQLRRNGVTSTGVKVK